jgi:hypothetical protein
MDTPEPPIDSHDASQAPPPQRFIRTFESDMRAVQSKTTPELTEVPVIPEPAPHETTQEAVQEPTVVAETSQLTLEREVTLPHQEPIREPLPVVTEPALPQVEREGRTAPPGVLELERPSPLETYSSDFSARLKETQASTATVLATEQDASRIAPDEAPGRGKLYLIGGAVLIVLGGVGAYLAYARYLTGVSPVVIMPTTVAPIFFDERVDVSGKGEALMREIQSSVSAPLASNAVRLLTHTSTSTDASVFGYLDVSPPPVLQRNIDSRKSMAGIVNVRGAQSPFFILSVSSYGSTFSGMLAWEATMPRELAPLYPSLDSLPSGADAALATTTKSGIRATSTPSQAFSAGFHDETIANRDVRVFRDSERRVILVYGYWNRTTLVIARDVAAFIEIIERLATSRS